jgi:CheY-like chemotaxis protein
MALILILDDEPDLVEACQLILESAGHRVEGLSSSGKALALMRRLRPELLLMDWVMPELDGGEILELLRRDEELGQTPVLVMSALVDGAQRAVKAGADGFLGKPFTAGELLAASAAVLAGPVAVERQVPM